MATIVRLLLVGDEALILATVKHGLRACGYEVATADSGEAALARAGVDTFQLAILDVRMPGMNGLELGRLLRERNDLPSIYLSAIRDDELVAEAVREGTLTYLVKPIDVAQLIPVVEAALMRGREIRALAQRVMHLDRAQARSWCRKLDDYCSEMTASWARGSGA